MATLSCVVLLFLFLFSAVFAKQQEERQNPFTEHYHKAPILYSSRSGRTRWSEFQAKVDNFNEKDTSTFAMRFNFNSEFCRVVDCPVVIFVGGESEITEGPLESGQIYEIGRENGAALFYTEHRFYGKSFPTTDISSDSLRLLHSSQAMEDIKGFITMLKQSDWYRNSKVMLFGCSYTGALAVWIKQRFPDLIHAVYSTSGPFLAKDSMVEHLQVSSRVIYDLPEVGKQCANDLFYGIQELEREYDSSLEGAASVVEKLGICPAYYPREGYDKVAVFQMFGIEFGNMVHNMDLYPDKLPTACKTLINAEGQTASERLVNYKNTNSDYCFPVDYYSTLQKFWNMSLSNEYRLWFYQQCNEFGWFPTTDTDTTYTQVFGQSVLPFFYHQLCRDAYGKGFTDEVILANQERTNMERGGKTPNVRKTVFVYGSNDPWAPMGVDKSLNEEAPLFWIDGGAHCQDMWPASNSDSESMKKTRVNTRAWIKKWMSED